jgi:hypothetical protein
MLGSAAGPTCHDLETAGYRFEAFGARAFDDAVSLLHGGLIRSFASFTAFTPIPLPEFRSLFGLGPELVHPRCSTFAFDESGALAGFAVVCVDLADAVRAMGGRTSWAARWRYRRRKGRDHRLLIHLGGITPSEARRRRGLARALFHRTVALVRTEGAREVLATLVGRGNPVRRHYGACAADERREYALFEIGA